MSENKKISLLSATLLSATAMVGSGWLFSPLKTAQIAGNWAFLAWILAAILMCSVAVCLSIVVAMYPVRGATTRSSSLSHNGMFGMPFAFANWFGLVAVVGTEAQATTQYLAGAMDSNLLMSAGSMTLTGKFFALFLLVVYLVINYYGVKLLAAVNNIVTIFKVFVPVFMVVVFLIIAFSSGRTMDNFDTYAGTYAPWTALIAVVGGGMIYTFNGFQLSASFSSEIKNPKRNVPLSMMFSILVVLVLYLLLEFGFMAAIPAPELAQAGGWANLNYSSPLLDLAFLLGLNFVGLLLIADSIVSPSGTGYSYLGGSSRMLYAMASEKQMPSWIATINPKYNISRRSMMVNFILVVILLWYSDSWASLMVIVTGYHIIGYMAAPISMASLKKSLKTRIFGTIVFIVLGLFMLSLPIGDMFKITLSLTVLMLVYAFTARQFKFKQVLHFSAPFLAYIIILFLIMLVLPLVAKLIICTIMSAGFFLIFTSSKYVAYCQHYTKDRVVVD